MGHHLQPPLSENALVATGLKIAKVGSKQSKHLKFRLYCRCRHRVDDEVFWRVGKETLL